MRKNEDSISVFEPPFERDQEGTICKVFPLLVCRLDCLTEDVMALSREAMSRLICRF